MEFSLAEILSEAFYHDGDAYRDPWNYMDDVGYSFFCLEGILT